jgi:uncharacterized repeat protein (TIGR03803 family)
MIIMKLKTFVTLSVATGIGILAPPLPAQTLTVLHNFSTSLNSPSFTNADGASPYSGLASCANILYGTAYGGGDFGEGTVFSISAIGTGFTVLHHFSGLDASTGTNADGAVPYGGVAVSNDAIYGSTINGGAGGNGTIFSIKTNGCDFTVLHSFFPAISGPNPNPNGEAAPYSALILSGGTLYGTAEWGGSNGMGSVFSICTNGDQFTVLHDFAGADGEYPFASLLLAGNTLYGTTISGGGHTNGTVFALNTNGTDYRLLHEFSPIGSTNARIEGCSPFGALIQTSNTLYGTTYSGGSNDNGTVFSMDTNGFSFTLLHSFDVPDGVLPVGNLVLAGTTLFGTTTFGSTNNNGTVFSVRTNGSDFAVIHTFTATGYDAATNGDGVLPQGSLLVIGNALYGTTVEGGLSDSGTLFRLDFLSVSNPNPNPDGTMTLSFSGIACSTNVTQGTTDLTSPVLWQDLGTNVADGNGVWQFTDTDAINHPIRFYRSITR